MEKVKVSAVSYTNTLPFIYGLKQSGIIHEIDLTLDVPSECAYKLINGYADLGIVPVAALLDISHPKVVFDYCIGASGAVDSVFIFCDKPIQEISSLRLDAQSRTSNGLARILLHHYWKKEVITVTEGTADAYVEIGDRTFGKKGTHRYAYDLSLHWEKLTGLPFTFAVWAANRPLPDSFIRSFNDALAHGVNHLETVIDQLPTRPDFDYRTYLTKNIDYRYDEAKKEAVTLYLKLLKSLNDIQLHAKSV